MSTTRLLLLTNEYPFDTGDVVFVSNEIDTIAAAFDEVVVFNYTAQTSVPSVRMPSNVRYGGNLRGGSRRAALLGLANPAQLRTFLAILFQEVRAGRLSGGAIRRLKAEAIAAVAGLKRSRFGPLRVALDGACVRISVYSFWGMGAAYVLPWIAGRVQKILLRLHRYDLYETDAVRLPLRSSLVRAADEVLAISDDGYRYLLDHYVDPNQASKVVVSRLGTRDPGVVERRQRGGGFTIVSCSTVTPVKRVLRILNGLDCMNDTDELTWIHFGDGVLMEDLRVAVENRVGRFTNIELRGQVRNDEVLNYYRHHRVDAFVNVSSSEGVPVSIMEALSFGIPVLATGVGGTGEIVGPALGSGELLPSDFTDEEFARALKRLLASEIEYRPRRVWERYCDAEVNAREVVRRLR